MSGEGNARHQRSYCLSWFSRAYTWSSGASGSAFTGAQVLINDVVAPLTSPCTDTTTCGMLFPGAIRPRGPPHLRKTPPVLPRAQPCKTGHKAQGKPLSSLPGRHVHKRETHPRPTPAKNSPRSMSDAGWGGVKNTFFASSSLRGAGRSSHNLVDAAVPCGTWNYSGKRRTGVFEWASRCRYLA